MKETLTAISKDILTVLSSQELYGLQLLRQLNIDRPTSLKAESIYPSLKRLEKKGYVSSKGHNSPLKENGSRCKYYQITELGISVLHGVQQYRITLTKRAKLIS